MPLCPSVRSLALVWRHWKVLYVCMGESGGDSLGGACLTASSMASMPMEKGWAWPVLFRVSVLLKGPTRCTNVTGTPVKSGYSCLGLTWVHAFQKYSHLTFLLMLPVFLAGNWITLNFRSLKMAVNLKLALSSESLWSLWLGKTLLPCLGFARKHQFCHRKCRVEVVTFWLWRVFSKRSLLVGANISQITILLSDLRFNLCIEYLNGLSFFLNSATWEKLEDNHSLWGKEKKNQNKTNQPTKQKPIQFLARYGLAQKSLN